MHTKLQKSKLGKCILAYAYLKIGIHQKYFKGNHILNYFSHRSLEKTRNIMPLHIEDNFKTNFTFMVVESEVENQKFYLVCHHQMNVFSFHVIMKSDDEEFRILRNLEPRMTLLEFFFFNGLV